MIIHVPTKKTYKTRLDAKRGLGGEVNYNKALKNNEFIFINTYKKDDIIF